MGQTGSFRRNFKIKIKNCINEIKIQHIEVCMVYLKKGWEGRYIALNLYIRKKTMYQQSEFLAQENGKRRKQKEQNKQKAEVSENKSKREN